MALQTVVSRRVDPSDPAVLTVGEIHSGTASNIIPERAMLTGTLRATTPRTRALLRGEVQRLRSPVRQQRTAYGEVVLSQGHAACGDDPAVAAICACGRGSLVGDDNVVPFRPN